ncbi:MAG TPA: hypothetical protein VMT30_05645 [Candidatus Saccharimonadia bacterium]|nr:hypothetical protein [Candidatus Saccharimonadia bacterium]
MTYRAITRRLLVAALLSAMPYATVNGVASATPAAPADNAQRLTNLKVKGDAEITRRIASLTAASEKLRASNKLTPADLAGLTAQINAELTGLANLQTKLRADTVLAAARTDAASIVSDYRVYALVLPKTRLVATYDRITAAQAKFTQLQAQLQIRLEAAKTAGKDTAPLVAAKKAFDAKLAASQSRTSGLGVKLLALQPSDYNADRGILEANRLVLVTARDDLTAARAAAKTIADGLKALK